jgi:transposase
MAKQLVSDALWQRIEPLIPERRISPEGGRPPVPDRQTLTGIIFVLKTGIPWEDLPQEMGCGSGMTCWRRLRDWQQAGVWDRLVGLLLDELRAANQIDFSRAAVDSGTIRAVGGADRSKPHRPPKARQQASRDH